MQRPCFTANLCPFVGFLVVMVVSAVGAMGRQAAFAASARPNILFIMADDHSAGAISAYGSKLNQTPHIDRLAQEGMRLTNCFVTNSICTPSRAAIITGKYAHRNGVLRFTPLDQSQPTLPKLLQEAGYHTGMVGKWHLMTNPRGFDYWSILPGQGRYFDPEFLEMGDESPTDVVRKGKRTVIPGYVTDIITDKVLSFLRESRSRREPFFLMYHHKAPHDPWLYDEKHARLYEGIEFPEPPTLFDNYEHRCDAIRKSTQKIGRQHTLYQRETGHLEGKARKKAQYQQYMKHYLRCIASVDDNVGRVLDYLDKSGLAENTIVIYTSDQGFFLGEHGLYDKRFMYEEALRMPFLVRWPGNIEPGSVNDKLVLNVDFAPTLLQAAGVKVPHEMQGRSFLPLLEGRTPVDWRKSMYYRYYFSHFNTEPHYGVRTRQYKLIYFHRIGQWELFDLTADPREMHSVYDEPAYADVVAKLKAELHRLQKKLDDVDSLP